jgi:hypothetical protein
MCGYAIVHCIELLVHHGCCTFGCDSGRTRCIWKPRFTSHRLAGIPERLENRRRVPVYPYVSAAFCGVITEKPRIFSHVLALGPWDGTFFGLPLHDGPYWPTGSRRGHSRRGNDAHPWVVGVGP